MATQRQIQCFSLFEAQGYSPEGAAAWVGNASQESGVNLPTAFRGSNLDHGSQGLMQWRLDRLTNYENFVKAKHPGISAQELWQWFGRLDYQVEFAAQECRTSYPTLDKQLRSGGSISTLTAAICWTYERPAKISANLANRVKQAESTFVAAPKVAATPSVTTALNHVAIQQASAAKGAVATAIATVAGAGGVALPHVEWHLPTYAFWILGALGVTAIVAVIGAIGAAQKSNAAVQTLATPPAAAPAALGLLGDTDMAYRTLGPDPKNPNPAKDPATPNALRVERPHVAPVAAGDGPKLTTFAQLEAGDTKVAVPGGTPAGALAAVNTATMTVATPAPVTPAVPPVAPAPATVAVPTAPTAPATVAPSTPAPTQTIAEVDAKEAERVQREAILAERAKRDAAKTTEAPVAPK